MLRLELSSHVLKIPDDALTNELPCFNSTRPKSDWLLNTLQTDWLILEYHEKAILNINMLYAQDERLLEQEA